MNDLLVAVTLFVSLFVALEIGFLLGRRFAAREGGAGAGQVGAIQGAALGLLGLLLAFSFGGAATRFLDRQDLIVEEANAIGTSLLRADLLPEPKRTELRGALRVYTEHRLELSPRLKDGLTAEDIAEFGRLQERLWRAAVDGVNARPDAMKTVLDPVNEVIDLHSLRLAAGRKKLPSPVLVLLFACSYLGIGTIGFGTGLSGQRRPFLTTALMLIVGGALWITFDLDHPRGGMLQLSDAPLREIDFGDAPSK